LNQIDVPITLVSRRSNRLVLLVSKHRLQILQKLRITLMSLTTHCPTTWSRQHREWQQMTSSSSSLSAYVLRNKRRKEFRKGPPTMFCLERLAGKIT